MEQATRESWLRAGLWCALAALAWSVAVPDLSGVGRANANDTATVATLKNLHSAQQELHAAAAIDCDRDGVGEYGFFREMTGARAVRGGGCLRSPVLPQSFRRFRDGVLLRSGYRLRLCLQGVDGAWIDESSATPVSVDASERRWLCYAWPDTVGSSGHRAYLINGDGVITASKMEGEVYTGESAPVPGVARFVTRDDMRVRAFDEVDDCGNVWVVVE